MFPPHKQELADHRLLPVAECRIRKSHGGFSLIELLTVMTIISIVVSVGVGSFMAFKNTDLDNALIDIGSAMEMARQTAISGNTYTYVAFTSPASTNPPPPLCIGVFQSGNGEDILCNALLGNQALAEESVAMQHKQWSIITKLRWLKNVALENTLTPDTGLVPAAELISDQFSNTINPLPDGLGFRLNRKMGNMPAAGTLVFDRVITFSPNGTAFVDNLSAVPNAKIGFLVRPSNGATPTPKERLQTAAFTVSGLLGYSQTYKLGLQ